MRGKSLPSIPGTIRSLLLAGAGLAPADRSVVLVTWDTTRADRIGCYGAARARTPVVDALAARGVRYERAWTVAPLTLPSHTSILSGALPCAHGVRDNSIFEVASGATLLQEVLHDSGFRTAAFVGAFVLDPRFGLDQGFEVYDSPGLDGEGGDRRDLERPADTVVDRALRWIDGLERGERFFLWLHFYDPHDPHPPAAALGFAGLEPYDAEIAACDRALGRVQQRLAQRGLDDGLVTVVTADHGESLGEHGEATHGTFLYEATMRVPLVVSPAREPGAVVYAPVSTADVAVTLLERLGVDRALLPDATSRVLPQTNDEGDFERALYLESVGPYYAHRVQPLRAIVWRGRKYVQTTRPELYDLLADPDERFDLTGIVPELAAMLAKRLVALTAEHPPLEWAGRTQAVSAEHAERMRALGYVSAPDDDDPFAGQLLDAKDWIVNRAKFDRILVLVNGGSRQELVEALALVEEIRASNPDDPLIDPVLSKVQFMLGNAAAAVEPLERLVTREPRNPAHRRNLASAYLGTDRAAWARRELEKAIWLEPESARTLKCLVELSTRARDWAAAAWWLDEAIRQGKKNEGGAAALEALIAQRAEVQKELDRVVGSRPRPPAPITKSDLLPEGVRAAESVPPRR